MINLLEWPHALFYQTRTFDSSTEDGLQRLLSDIHHTTAEEYLIDSSLSKAINVAYGMAVALYNTPGIYYDDFADLSISFDFALQEHWGIENLAFSIDAEQLMGGIMTYAILFLQANKSMELSCFLVQFKKILLRNKSSIEHNMKCKLDYVKKMFDTIEKKKERFYSNLSPETLEPSRFTYKIWRRIASFEDEEFEYLLALNDTKERQQELLELSRIKFSLFSDFTEEIGFQYFVISESEYLEYSMRIEEGEFLNMPKNLVRRADDTSIAKRFTVAGASLEDLYDWHYKSIAKLKATQHNLEKQLVKEQFDKENFEHKMRRKAIEQEKIQSLSDKVMRENEQLKADYAQLNEHYENLQMAYDEILNERYGDQELVSEPDNIDWQQQEEARQEYEESVADSISNGLKKVISFCVKYAHDTGNVLDNELNHFKQMMDDLLDSDLAVGLKASDQLDLYKEIGKINEGRKAHLAALVKEQLQSQQQEKSKSLFEHLHVNGEQVIVGGNGEYKNEAIDYDTRRNIGSGGEAEG